MEQSPGYRCHCQTNLAAAVSCYSPKRHSTNCSRSPPQRGNSLPGEASRIPGRRDHSERDVVEAACWASGWPGAVSSLKRRWAWIGSPPASIERRLFSASCRAWTFCCSSSCEERFQKGMIVSLGKPPHTQLLK